MKVRVEVSLKSGGLDVQGKAIEGALHGLGFGDVSGVRVGKTIAFEIAEEPREKAEARVRSMCERLLANTVIESYRVEIG